MNLPKYPVTYISKPRKLQLISFPKNHVGSKEHSENNNKGN